MDMETILRSGLDALGVPCPEAAPAMFHEYFRLLEARGSVMNLTAIEGEAAAARLHFLDCAALLTLTDFSGRSVVDVGTGAGFPGLPLKILCPDLSLTLLDSQLKRVGFLEEVVAALGLTGVTCVCARAEETPELRESFDIAVSRAVARLNMLCELCLPLVRPGGLFIAMKGPDCAAELAQAQSGIALLGGGASRIAPYTVPGADLNHAAVLTEKAAPTPPAYPRRFARIKAKPV